MSTLLYGWTETENAWRAKAACEGRGADMFPTTEPAVRRALNVCRSCSVIDECAAFATAGRITAGVWGGRHRTATVRVSGP